MAKYVCDFQTVTSLGNEMCKLAEEVDEAVYDYNSRIYGNICKWSGDAKNSFETANKSQVDTTKEDAKYLKELGEFIKTSAKNIQSLEEELAKLKI